MSFKVESSIEKLKKKTKYTLQITTDNYEQFLFIQKMAAECANGKENDCEPFDYNEWVKKNINYPVPNKLTTLGDSISNVPACCKNCSNHPSNGGSGICNCAAPYLGLVTCDTYSISNINGTYSTTEQNANNLAQPATTSCNKV